ncbi:MAG: NAD(P)/FAD-dependent oxidoreductase [Chloroflexota bacterium]|nr:NAD(P)/FAD-dependent oxidoreductase [Chloroflexota bacterium]
MQEKYDFIVIGGGVVGCIIARTLSRYKGRVLLIEKEADVAMGTTAANTSIVHAGYDPLPNTLKAYMNVEGNAMWDQLAGELNFPFERRGDFVVAVGEDELPDLDVLMEQAKKNGVPGCLLLSGAEVRRREKSITPETSGALWASTGGITDPFAVTVAAIENAIINGAEVKLNTEFQDFIMEGDRIIGIKTNRGDFLSRWVVNCAGLYSDFVMHQAGVRPEFKISPRKGEYFVFDPAHVQIDNVLFPVPSEKGKGILVSTTIHGNTLLGPNADIIEDKEDTSTTLPGMDEIWAGAQKLVPSLSRKNVIATFAGLRAMGNGPCETPGVDYNKDYVIEIPEKVKGFVNLGGIESPGLAASPAIAKRVVDLLRDAGEELRERKDWDPIRPSRPRFKDMSQKDRKLLVDMDPSYGRIICRCENVTEGEVIAEIHAPLPATTYDAIKRRTWLGTGRCQGGFDTPRVVEILARELGVSPLEITKRGKGSEFLFRPTKKVEG